MDRLLWHMYILWGYYDNSFIFILLHVSSFYLVKHNVCAVVLSTSCSMRDSSKHSESCCRKLSFVVKMVHGMMWNHSIQKFISGAWDLQNWVTTLWYKALRSSEKTSTTCVSVVVYLQVWQNVITITGYYNWLCSVPRASWNLLK